MPLRNGNIAVFGADGRRERVRRRGKIVGLAAEKNEVERLAQSVRRDGRRVRQIGIAERAADDQPGLRQLRGAPRPHQEGHVAAGLQQPAAEIAADRAGADHEDTHAAYPLAGFAGRFGTSKLPVNIMTVSSF